MNDKHSVDDFSGKRYLSRARQVLRIEAGGLTSLAHRLDQKFEQLVNLCRNCEGLIVVAGIGKSGLIAEKWAATLASVGVRSTFLDAGRALHGDSGILSVGDLLISLSVSGETQEVCALLDTPSARSGVTRVVVTSHSESNAARRGDLVIPLGNLTEADDHQLLPTTSSTALLALGDALAVCLSEARGLTREEFFGSHPAGGLGLKQRGIRDVMRTGVSVRTAFSDRPVRDVLRRRHIPGRRSGAVPIVERNGMLCGVLTDSDLVRLLETGRDNLLDGPVHAVMTGDPIAIEDTACLLDAVAMLSIHRVSEIPVVDRDGYLVGLLDITDVIGYFPLSSSDSQHTAADFCPGVAGSPTPDDAAFRAGVRNA